MRIEYLRLLVSHRRHYGRIRPYLSLFVSISNASIEIPADCGICSVIRFINAKEVKATEIQRQISEVYEENIMREGIVRKWVSVFKDGRTNVHDEERSGRPSVITEDLVQKVDGKV
ncbi:hypothetical protein AVEN_246752-1 [Araneus ventricosus]|uniref:Mos1 transposase HTH domain-containing protein n=1 Tax=Araneus ventricosus TaxID=182803 RepID=A0A4Y2GIY0_ARAVE|nr:hypothetical protein AVEN_232805-1 [Araneus ventricosus]GBM52679.1 hypothetical protein AVEN_246752-1 [Araneus ventricosus]